MSFSIFIASFLITSNPGIWEELNPQGHFRFRYEEDRQKNLDESGLELDLSLGVFPEIAKDLELGIQLRTSGTNLGDDPASIKLDSGMSSKSLSISQSYLAWRAAVSNRFETKLVVGKFKMPILTSPLTWYEELHPEGLYESLVWKLASTRLNLRTQHLQISADRVSPSITSSTPIRRSWLFVNSFGADWASGRNFLMKTNLVHYYLLDASERLRELGVERGNSIQNQSTLTLEKFSPLELNLDLLTSQFGFETEFTGSLAINLKSKNKDRSFHASARVGNQNTKNAVFAQIEYLYNEPNTQLAAFLDPDWGYINRKGPRFRLSYFVNNQSVLRCSVALLQRLESNLIQADLFSAFVEFQHNF